MNMDMNVYVYGLPLPLYGPQHPGINCFCVFDHQDWCGNQVLYKVSNGESHLPLGIYHPQHSGIQIFPILITAKTCSHNRTLAILVDSSTESEQK